MHSLCSQLFTKMPGVDGDVDGEDDDDDDVVVVTSKMTVQRARPALHAAAMGVTSVTQQVDALQPAGQGRPRYEPRQRGVARQCLRRRAAEVASVVMLRRNTHKLHRDWTQCRASTHASKP